MILHKLTLMCTKYEVNRCTQVEVISIFVGGIFWGVTLYITAEGEGGVGYSKER